jgi:hypothetical protein
MTAISAAVVAADIGAPKAETWQAPPGEDSSDEEEDEDDNDSSDDEDEDDEEEDSSDDEEPRLVPRLSPTGDEL